MEQILADCRLRLDGLMRDGLALRDRLAASHSGASIESLRSWQQDCATLVNELSGGSKAHWLAREFSEAFLVRSSGGDVVSQAPVAEIVDRLVGVLERAGQSLALLGQTASSTSNPAAAPLPHRFDFVHNKALRPLLEQAYADGRDAL